MQFGVIQGFPAQRKAGTTHVKNYIKNNVQAHVDIDILLEYLTQ